MDETFRKKLLRGELLIGTVITLPSPEIAEIYAMSGFDWLFLDLEHSVMSLSDAQRILQSTASETHCLVRVPSIDEVWIKKALDMGPSGIIIPQVKTVDDVTRVVQLCKYPPDGSRSVGIARAQGYGETFQEYVSNANEKTAIIVQIEHEDAVKKIEDIVNVSGVDCLFIGPYDLSTSMGKPGMTTDPDVLNAITKVENFAKQAKTPLGIFGSSAEAVRPYIQRGYSLVAVGIDTMLIANAAKSIIESLKV
jgi:2-dehydro-3-deoxyglucarate aldolase/4-hydroxy-2-oxoheptanedioate aldolase